MRRRAAPGSNAPGDRKYWDIETGWHLRLGFGTGEDRCRVRHRTSALNLALLRRAAVSVAGHGIRECPHLRQATMNGFLDTMSAQQGKRPSPSS